MFKTILDYLGNLSDNLIKLDKTIGFGGLLKYAILIVVIIGLFNFKEVVKTGIEIVTDLQEEIHNDKLVKRDELMGELLPLLSEFRGYCSADRILYFEYHNSKENLVGIPFKYLDLMLQCNRYGIAPVTSRNFRDINSGLIVELYEKIKFGDYAYCGGDSDHSFQAAYPGVHAYFSEVQDDTKQRMFLSIPGYKQPLGMIVIEWADEVENRDLEKVQSASKVFLPRITALINSKVIN
jgi:hypothetical protein